MTSGFEKNQERKNRLNSFAKDLVRRAKSKCELCETGEVKLTIFELPPFEDEPEIGSCLLVCEKCVNEIQHPKLMDIEHWRCLYHSIWSEVDAIQVLSIHLLETLSDRTDWAADLVTQIDLRPENEEWLQQIKALLP